MKRILVLAVAASAMVGAFAKSDKRGVSENNFSMGSMLEALEPGVTWYYNWGNTPGKGFENQVIDFEGIEFVPMCWNANYNADAIREYCKSHPATKYLLGFNEPNFTAQANMTPQVAAEEWPKVKALADELGLKLVAPALNYSPNPPYTDPLRWMDEFVALVGLDAFDYTAIHNYGGVGVMIDLATKFHNRYSKDVWVTEFCYWPNEGNPNSSVAPATQIDSMAESLYWLETTPWIFRYAWFKALGNSNAQTGPNYGLLVHEGSGTDPWTLSEQGKVYVGLSQYDSDVWHPVSTVIPATEFAAYNLVGIGSTADTSAPGMLEVNKFNAGATADWQFDIKEAGEHVITLRVSGYGEPTRFDPQLQWMIMEGDSEKELSETFHPALPNSDSEYKEISEKVYLPSGHVTLRLKDKAPYQPSGLHISSIRVDNLAGVGEVTLGNQSNDAIYNLHGVRLGHGQDDLNKLPAGIYIIGGKKVMKTM